MVIIAGATALALAAGASVATAAAMSNNPVDSSGVIHGCWTNAELNGSHAFVLQDAGASCPKGTTAISWNMQGPEGPAGPTGPAGATGAAGATGPAGLAGAATAGPGGLNVTVVTDGDSSIGGDYDFASAECPASAPYVVGGNAVSAPPAGALTASEPYDFTTGAPVNGTNTLTPFIGAEVSGDRYGWVATIPQGSQSTFAKGGLDVYAICSA
jgi:hypothetical protein